MEILPDDIWLKVFTFLSQRELLRIALVCRTWNRLSRDSSLWSHLDLEPLANSLGSNVMQRLINTMFAPLGKHLSLNKNLVTTEILQGLFEHCCRLESLSLNDCRFHSSGAWFELRPDQVDKLTFLDLRNASGFASGVEDIFKKAYNLKYLGKFTFCACGLYFNGKLFLCRSEEITVLFFFISRNFLHLMDCVIGGNIFLK